ncbi:hypothetical protein MMC34_005367 [Xylographa carneopallida]|nr:hypothetical protein [Xylographa carneopallida]
MNISRLLNPDPGTSPLLHDAAGDPHIFGGEAHGRQAMRPRSKFIDLVTASHVEANRMNPKSHDMTAVDGPALDPLRSGVNDGDESSYRVASSFLPHENLIFPRTTPSPSEASRSSVSSVSSQGKSDLVGRLPIGSISLNSRDSSCASNGMAPTRLTRQGPPTSTNDIDCNGRSHRHDHKRLTRHAARDSSSEEQLDDDYASDDSEKDRSRNKLNYKSWNDVPMEFRCTFVEGCILDSPDRKVISHLFGRNKKCTRAIPEDVWAPFCRRHYQRTRYRNVKNFGGVQLDLVRRTVENLQNWGGVSHFELILRKRAMQAIKRDERHHREEKNLRTSTTRCSLNQDKALRPETWLVPHLGKGKSFEDILKVVDLIEEHMTDKNCKLPEFEILPFYKPGRMNILTSKKTLKGAAKPEGIRKRQNERTASASRSVVQSKSVATGKSTPATTPKTTPSLTPRTLETRSGRGDIARGQPLRASAVLLQHTSPRLARRHSTP